MAAVVSFAVLAAPASSQPPAASPGFRSHVDLVYVNVVVRDKRGVPVRGLKADDFLVTEDGKPQTVRAFSFEEVSTRAESAGEGSQPGAPVLTKGKLTPAPRDGARVETAASPAAAGAADAFKGTRLIVLFFDLSAMQPEEIGRAAAAARNYVQTSSSPADRIAIVSLVSALEVVQDFTADRAATLAALQHFDANGNQGFEEGETDVADSSEGGAFTADDTEFNLYNTDRRLEALASLADALAGIEQKKSIVYFSGGMNQSGTDNQVQLKRTIDRAIRANVSFYTADARGLQAFVPGGEASQASPGGTAAFTGQSMRDRGDRMFQSQEALSALAEDTGGQALFDTNDLGDIFARVVADTSAYYIVGYESTNTTRDGRFRRISVRAKSGDYKIQHRAGYYAAKDFTYFTRQDREQQLQEQLFAEISATDLPLYVSATWFRLKGERFSVPVTLLLPGSRLTFQKDGDTATASVDVLGMVLDAERRPIARIRDTVKLTAATEADQHRLVRYLTGFELVPGAYRLKLVARENRLGTIGSFEMPLSVPNLDRQPIKFSSVLLGTKLVNGPAVGKDPLSMLNTGLVPSALPIVSARDPIYLYVEVYDPAGRSGGSGGGPMRLLASVSFFRGAVRMYQTPIAEMSEINVQARQAVAWRLSVPASALTPGAYTCQLNLIDDVAGTFAFPRVRLVVRP